MYLLVILAIIGSIIFSPAAVALVCHLIVALAGMVVQFAFLLLAIYILWIICC